MLGDKAPGAAGGSGIAQLPTLSILRMVKTLVICCGLITSSVSSLSRSWIDRNARVIPTKQSHQSLDGLENPCISTLTEDDGIKVVTYNILGPLHAMGTKHDYSSLALRQWPKRRKHLIEYIRTFDADIL